LAFVAGRFPDSHLSEAESEVSPKGRLREPRNDDGQRPLDTIGLAINRYLGEHFYISGQAHSAFARDAGAFSVGLLGVGVATARLPLRAGTELLVGAASCGVPTGGGATTQGLVWATRQSAPQDDWRADRLLSGSAPRRGSRRGYDFQTPCFWICSIIGGSRMAATISSSPPQFGQCAMSDPRGQEQLSRSGGVCSSHCASAGLAHLGRRARNALRQRNARPALACRPTWRP
jgi:hypothetical protein